jgi:hypothetical protein
MPSLTPSSPLPMRNARTPAERMRLFRRRRKFRRQVVTVEVDPREVDALIDRGYLEQKDRDDLVALAAAFKRVLFRRSRDTALRGSAGEARTQSMSEV